MDNFLESITGSLPGILAGVLILILAFVIAILIKKAIVKLLNKGSIKSKLASKNADPGEADKIIGLLGNIVFVVIFLLFLPAALAKLGLGAVATPFAGFTSFILDFLPKLVAAIVILYIGFFVAKVIRDIVSTLLARVGVDRFVSKHVKNEGENSVKISEVLANIVYAFIIVPLIIVALDIVGLTAIAEPARNIINDFLGYVPKIFVAVLLIGVGFFIARLISNLLKSILAGLNVDGLLAKVGVSKSFNLSEIISKVVLVVLMIIFSVEALNVLNLEVLTNIGGSIIAYLPLVLGALLILVGAYLLGNYAEKKIVEKNPKNAFLAMTVKTVILAVAVFMSLSQLGLAKNIVEHAFIIVLGAIAVAFALAFGIGGKDFAKDKLNKLDKKIDSEKKDVNL